jgi:multiple sugar transport system permease protein
VIAGRRVGATLRSRRGRAFLLRLSVLSVAAIAYFSPLFWLVKSSFEPERVIRQTDLSLWLREPTLRNYALALADPQFGIWYRNSAIVSGVTMVVTVLVSTLAAYSLARLPSRFARVVGPLFMLAYIVPGVMVIVPLFVMIVSVEMHDTFLGLIVTYTSFSVPFGSWLLRAYFAGLPAELEDAALVDGCSRLGALFRIVLPLAAPAIVTVSLFGFVLAWSDVLFAMVFTNSNGVRPIGAGLPNYLSAVSGSDPTPGSIGLGQAFAICVLVALPVVLVFLVLQRWLVQGLSAGGIKG